MRPALLGALASGGGIANVGGLLVSPVMLGSGGTMNLPYPAGCALNDILIGIVVDDTGAPIDETLTWDAPWVLKRRINIGSGSPGVPDGVSFAWLRYAGGSSVNVTASGKGSSTPTWGAILNYRGCTTVDAPIDGNSGYTEVLGAVYTQTKPNTLAPDVVTTTPSCRVINIFLEWGGYAVPPASVVAPPEYSQDFAEVVPIVGGYGGYTFDARGRAAAAASTYSGGTINLAQRPTIALSFALMPPGAPSHIAF